jgi:hypothetical protein
MEPCALKCFCFPWTLWTLKRKRDVNYDRTVVPMPGFLLKRKRHDILCFSFPTWPISASPIIYWVFITLSQGYHHCDPSSSVLRRLLRLPDTRRTTRRWQNIGRCVEPALIGQAGKTNVYLHFVLFVALFGVKKVVPCIHSVSGC